MFEVKEETEFFFLTLSSAESESALTAREQTISLNNKNLYMYFVCFLLPNVYINNVSKIRWAYQLKEKKKNMESTKKQNKSVFAERIC